MTTKLSEAGDWECAVGVLTCPKWPGRRKHTFFHQLPIVFHHIPSHLGYRIILASKTGVSSGNQVFLHPTAYVRIRVKSHLGSYFIDLNTLGPFQHMLLPSIFFPQVLALHLGIRKMLDYYRKASLWVLYMKNVFGWLFFKWCPSSSRHVLSVCLVTCHLSPINLGFLGLLQLTAYHFILGVCQFPPGVFWRHQIQIHPLFLFVSRCHEMQCQNQYVFKTCKLSWDSSN